MLDLFPGVRLTGDVDGVAAVEARFVETTLGVVEVEVWFDSTKHIDNNVR